MRKCPKTCRFCHIPECADNDPDCQAEVKRGRCMYTHMIYHCKLSCRYCHMLPDVMWREGYNPSSEGKCQDRNNQYCKMLANPRRCRYLQWECPQSCALCEKQQVEEIKAMAEDALEGVKETPADAKSVVEQILKELNEIPEKTKQEIFADLKKNFRNTFPSLFEAE